MAQVVKCDQCGKVDQPNQMKSMHISIGKETRDMYAGNHRSGDFCSQECIKLYIYAQLNDLWYAAKDT